MTKIEKTPLLIFFTWLAICGSIGIDFNVIVLGIENKNNIYTYFNQLRIAISILAILVFLIWNFSLFVQKKNFINIFKLNTTFVFVLFFLCQFIGLLQNNSEILNYNNYYLLFLSLGTLNLFLFITNSGNESYYKILLYLLLVIMLLHSFLILATKFDVLIENIPRGLTLYTLTDPNELFMGQTIPRITGLSRSIAILNLFLIVWYFHISHNFGIAKKTIYILLIMSIGLLIWAMNSRGAIFCYFFSLTIYFLSFLKESLFTRIKFLILIGLIPVVIFSILTHRTIITLEKKEFNNVSKEEFNNISEKKKMLKQFNNRTFGSGYDNYTSGRIVLWKYSINNYQKNKIFGYGPQGDRYLLRDKFTSFGNNVSNGFLYALLSGGYVGLVLFCFLFLKSFYNIGLIIINRKELNTNFIIKSSVLFLSFFLLRSIVENSFSLFSLDFLIFALSSVILEKFIKERKLKIPSFK